MPWHRRSAHARNRPGDIPAGDPHRQRRRSRRGVGARHCFTCSLTKGWAATAGRGGRIRDAAPGPSRHVEQAQRSTVATGGDELRDDPTAVGGCVRTDDYSASASSRTVPEAGCFCADDCPGDGCAPPPATAGTLKLPVGWAAGHDQPAGVSAPCDVHNRSADVTARATPGDGGDTRRPGLPADSRADSNRGPVRHQRRRPPYRRGAYTR